MFTFAYSGLLFLLILIPAMTLLFVVFRFIRRRRLRKLGDPKVLSSLMPELSPYKSNVRFIFAMLGLGAVIIALARPWGGVKNQETSREGIEIVIAVDASNSMLASATGEESGVDRMKTAKLVLEKLINRLGNDRVGLIAYAGDAYTLIPVTNDYVSAKAFLNSIDPSLIPHQGTNIGAAISLAENSFSDNSDVGKAIILLTDAEELEDQEGTVNEVVQARKRGIQTDVIGIGSTPVTIPSANRGRMIDDETGEVVRTSLNEDLAVEIARAGDGIYVNASNDDAVDELIKQLAKLKKAALESSFLVTHDELYWPFVVFAILMIIIDFIMTNKRNKWLDKITFFKHETPIVICLVLSIGMTACGKKEPKETDVLSDENVDNNLPDISRRDSLLSVYSFPKERDFIAEGNNYFNQQNFELADSNYIAALAENPRSVVASLNSGLASVRNIQRSELQSQDGQLPDSIMGPMLQRAISAFQAASAPKIEKENVSSKAFYNEGNINFTQKQFDEAIKNYKEALRLNPEDDKARRNLRIAQLQKKDNNQNQQQNQQQNQEQNQNQQQNQQQHHPSQQINEQTSEQILNAAERKENIRRAQIQTQNQKSTDKSGRSFKKW